MWLVRLFLEDRWKEGGSFDDWEGVVGDLVVMIESGCELGPDGCPPLVNSGGLGELNEAECLLGSVF